MAIGTGGSCKVFKATNIQTDERVAVKIIRFDKLQSIKNGEAIIETEYCRMKILEDHPNILKSYFCNTNGVFEMKWDCMGVMYNVIELAENGNLANIIKFTGELDEEIAKFYFKQILHAINHIHFFGIAHMDIKLENILLDNYYNAKIADFGVSVDASQNGGIDNKIRGTIWYMAPEIVNLKPGDTYNVFKADIYSLGVCFYLILFGEFPLKEDQETCSNFGSDILEWIDGVKLFADNRKHWEYISYELQKLLGRMLSFNPNERPSISEIMEWSWLQIDWSKDFIQEVFEDMDQRKTLWKDIMLQQTINR